MKDYVLALANAVKNSFDDLSHLVVFLFVDICVGGMIAKFLPKSNAPAERRRPQVIPPPGMEMGQLAIKLEWQEKWMDIR
jgi:hypothetical protein